MLISKAKLTVENDYSDRGYEYSEDFGCYVCYLWNNGWQYVASFETEDEAIEWCLNN